VNNNTKEASQSRPTHQRQDIGMTTTPGEVGTLPATYEERVKMP
jgi:hypothetical protein